MTSYIFRLIKDLPITILSNDGISEKRVATERKLDLQLMVEARERIDY